MAMRGRRSGIRGLWIGGAALVGILSRAAPTYAVCFDGAVPQGVSSIASCGWDPRGFVWLQHHGPQRVQSLSGFDSSGGVDSGFVTNGPGMLTDLGSGAFAVTFDWGNWGVDGCVFDDPETDSGSCNVVTDKTYGVTN